MTVNKMPLLIGTLGLLFGSSVWATPTSGTQLCINNKCVNANQVATPVALYHRLGELFTKNTGRKITFCDADPAIHLCFQQMLRLSASSSVMTADVQIDAADMLEVKMSQDETSLTALLDMSVEANGTYPECATAQAQVVVDASDKVSVMIDNFGCAFTSASTSDLNMGFAVDYIDFEKAVLGGYYTFSASQAMHGMRSGYALLRFAEPVSGEFDGIVMAEPETVVHPVVKEKVITEKTVTPEKECAPCMAEKIRDDDVVRGAIEAAARAEAEAKAAAERAVKMAEEAAQTTSDYAQKKAEEAEKAKKEAEKAAEMAKAARSRVDNKVAAMNCQSDKKTETEPEQTPTLQNEVVKDESAVAKTVTTKTTIIKHIDADGNVSEQVIDEPSVTETVSLETPAKVVVLTETVKEPQVEMPEVIIETPSAPQIEETFSQKWNRWMHKAGRVFWLEEPLF